MAINPKKLKFIRSMSVNSPFYLLMEHLPGVSFFAKNLDHEIVCANSSFLERLGVKTEDEIIGQTDDELFPKSLAEHFRADDEWVIANKKPKLHIIELFVNTDGLPDWYLTHKLPVFGDDGEPIGIMGTSQNYQHDKQFIQPYLQIEPAIRYIQENFRSKITIKHIAERVHLSPRQLDRRFQEILRMSPQEFVMKIRLKTACEELSKTSNSILDIALGLGFYDQSSFTQQFRKHMGSTPLQYRKQHQTDTTVRR